MASYQVASHNFVGGEFGQTITDEQLEGCDIEALLAGGHLVPAVVSTPAPVIPPESAPPTPQQLPAATPATTEQEQ